jgi:hypothetical protein
VAVDTQSRPATSAKMRSNSRHPLRAAARSQEAPTESANLAIAKILERYKKGEFSAAKAKAELFPLLRQEIEPEIEAARAALKTQETLLTQAKKRGADAFDLRSREDRVDALRRRLERILAIQRDPQLLLERQLGDI